MLFLKHSGLCSASCPGMWETLCSRLGPSALHNWCYLTAILLLNPVSTLLIPQLLMGSLLSSAKPEEK